MAPYRPSGGVGGPMPGTLGPAELDGRAEWVPVHRTHDLLDALETRLGSEVDLRRVVLAVLSPLRTFLEGEPLAALGATLPQDLARELADADLNLNVRVRAVADAAEYVDEVSRLLLHPPRTAAEYARAVFASAKGALDPAAVQAISDRLPPELGATFRAAR